MNTSKTPGGATRRSEPARLSRREFLGTAGAAVMAPMILPAGVLGINGKPGANDRILIGHIGTGGMGSHLMEHSLYFEQVGQAAVAAVCDVDSRRLAVAMGDRRDGYRDYRALLERKDIDAVVIATPDHWHAAQMVHAAECGKHVYVEKPACCTIQEGTAMIRAARENRVAVQVGSQGRSQEEAYLAHRYVANGNIGTVRRVDCFHYPSPSDDRPVADSEAPDYLDWDLWLGPLRWRPYNRRYAPVNFRWLMESGGGQIRDRGAHVMSCAMHWLGADGTWPVSVEATGTQPASGLWDTCVEMQVTYTFKNPDWVLTWNQPGNPVPPEPRSGAESHIERPGYGAVYTGDAGSFHHWGGDGGTWVERKVREWAPGPGAVEVPKSPGHMRDWHNGIRTGTKTIMNIEAAVGVADLCNLGNLAFLLGRKLEWDGARREFIGDPAANRLLGRPQRFPHAV
jgi:predicted dehydrogenase